MCEYVEDNRFRGLAFDPLQRVAEHLDELCRGAPETHCMGQIVELDRHRDGQYRVAPELLNIWHVGVKDIAVPFISLPGQTPLHRG